MSFKTPRPPRVCTQSSLSGNPSTSFSQDASPRDHHLTPPSDAPKTRRGYGTKGRVHYRNNEVIVEPLGCIFVQQQLAHPWTSTSTAIPPPESILDDPFADAGNAEPTPIYVLVGGEDAELQRQRQRRKKERQWAKWANETIPSLLQPYLKILCESDNLHTLNCHPDVTMPACSCERRASINVTCVFFEHKLVYLQYHNIY